LYNRSFTVDADTEADNTTKSHILLFLIIIVMLIISFFRTCQRAACLT
jgi:hypothetical protein